MSSLLKCSMPHPFAFFLAKGWEPQMPDMIEPEAAHVHCPVNGC